MIIGSLKTDEMQILSQNNSYFAVIVDTIKKTNFSNYDDGIYPIENESIFFILSTYKTKQIEDSFSEAHKKYIDFQYLVYGEELIGYTNYYCIKRNQSEYDNQKDIELFNNVTDESFFILKKDMFAVFYPYEIHRPGISHLEIRSVRKAVFKILVKDQIWVFPKVL